MAKRIQKQARRYREDSTQPEHTPLPTRQASTTDSTSVDDLIKNIDDVTAAHRATTPKPSAAEKAEVENLNKDTFYKPDEAPAKLRGGLFRRHRNKIGVGGIAGVIITAAFLFLSPPFEIIHWGTQLTNFHFGGNEEASTSRVSKAYRWMKYSTSDERHMRRLGSVKNRWANSLETRISNNLGMQINTNAGGYIDSLTITDRAKVPPDMLANFEAEGRVSGDTITLGDASNFYNRRVINNLVQGLGHNKIGLALPMRGMLQTRFGATLRPFGNLERKADQTIRQWYDDWREERKQNRRVGDTTISTKVNDATEGETQDQIDNQTGAQQDLDATIAENQYDPEKVRADFGKFTSRSLLGLGLLCLINGINEVSDQIEYFEAMLPMMRMASEVISGADQAKAGEVSLTELGFLNEDFYDEVTKTSVKDARSMEAESGQPANGPDIPLSARFGGANDTLEAIGSVAGNIPGVKTACSVLGGWIGFVLEITIDAIVAGGTLGIGSVVKEIGEDAAMGHIAAAIANYLAAQPVNLNAKGAELGNYINYGARLMANDQALGMGGSELSPSEEVALDNVVKQNQRQAYANRSWAYKLFALEDPNSLAGKVYSALTPPQELFAAFKLPSFATAGANIGNYFGGNQAQAAEKYDYGFPEVGFSVDELNDPRFENPYTNEEELFSGVVDSDEDEDTNTANEEAKYLTGLNVLYGQPCFGVWVNNDGTIDMASTPIDLPGQDEFDYGNDAAIRFNSKSGHYQSDKCRGKSGTAKEKETLLRYRFLILDILTQNSLACYEGDKTSCDTLGVAGDDDSTEEGAIVSDDVQELASDILKQDSVTYELSTTQDVMEALASGQPAFTTCDNATNETSDINPDILKFILAASQKTNVQVNALTDRCHSDGSNHYSGEAVDLDLQSSGPLSILDPIAAKYGGSKNFETTHHHYDFIKD